MWNEAARTVERDLGPGESLLWAGSPRKGLLLRPADALMIPFSLLWGGFALFWESSVIIGGGPFFFKLWGIPFVLIGLYMIVGRFFVDAKLRERTSYAITSERVLIDSGLFNKTVNSVYLRTLNNVAVERRADGSGNITFGPTNPLAAWTAATPWVSANRQMSPRFELIPDVDAVAEVIRQAQRAATTTQPNNATRPF